MGRRRPFIDKKSSTTYNLIYRPTEEDAEQPERLLVDAGRGVGIGRPDAAAAGASVPPEADGERCYPLGHPLAWLDQDASSASLAEERRREIVGLGMPDDGYDYLQHLRVCGGPGKVEGLPDAADTPDEVEAAAAGPSVYVPAPKVEPPPEDVKLFDARRLTLHQPAVTDDEAALGAGGVTAFSRERERLWRAQAEEVDQIAAAMRALEDDGAASAGGSDFLEDDFVLAATRAAEVGSALPGPGTGVAPAEGPEQASSDDEAGSSGWSSEESDPEGDGAGERGDGAGESTADRVRVRAGSGTSSEAGSRRAGSIASTYWRPERADRKAALSAIDEQFEHLALEYDSDEIGDLEDEGVGPPAGASLDQFGGMLDEFLAVHATPGHAHEGGQAYHSAAEAVAAAGPAVDENAAVAIAKARELLRLEEARAERREGSTDDPRPPPAPFARHPDAAEEQRWDCESVLSLRSNADNHPALLAEPARRRRATGGCGDGASITGESVASAARRRGETAEEKRERKAAIKETRRAARAAKKETKLIYKEEVMRMQQRIGVPAPSVISLP
ncbi:hypothetical protein WJX81_007566 [Elliptochloris bilobata]|uniref:LTV1-like protein n=1 Tax=Elliptochloris bilobata TaxID=381761 RepID=A0AAW1SJL9_9CHLO